MLTTLIKRCLLFCAGILLVTAVLPAQFKSNSEPGVSQSLVKPAASVNSFLGLLNPDNFLMRHNIAFNYMTFGGASLSLASYTNSMNYKIADPLDMRVDLTLQGSPFGNGGSLSQSNLNKLFISRAELNYHPADNLFIQLQYRELPMNYWGSNGYYPYSQFWGDR